MDILEQNGQNPLPPENSSGEKSVGPIVGIVIIVIILIIGALYVWGQKITENKKVMNEQTQNTNATPSAETETETETDSVTANLQTQSNSDDIDSIKGDLNATSFDSIDQ